MPRTVLNTNTCVLSGWSFVIFSTDILIPSRILAAELCDNIDDNAVLEKEWTHHGILLLAGLHQIAEWTSHETVKKERIAEARITGVKVGRTLCVHL